MRAVFVSYRKPLMSTRFWRACALALLLLFVQQLAATHVLEHSVADVLQQAPDGDGTDCPECLAFAGLQPGGANAGVPWSVAALADVPLALDLAAGLSRQTATAHTIRAPPENRD